MSSVDTESLILAQNLKNERNAIPVNITAAVEAKRIDPKDFMDDSMKDIEEGYKADLAEAKKAFDRARKEEKKMTLSLAKRKALKKGTRPIKTDEDKSRWS